jgi:hypothetical protein
MEQLIIAGIELLYDGHHSIDTAHVKKKLRKSTYFHFRNYIDCFYLLILTFSTINSELSYFPR